MDLSRPRQIAFWVMIMIVIGLAVYLIIWTRSESYECVKNPYNYSFNLLEKANSAPVSCTCTVLKPNGMTVKWDKDGFSKMSVEVVDPVDAMNGYKTNVEEIVSPEAKAALNNQAKTLKRIVIDPGHGGTDPGANGRFSTEAAVSLAISTKLADYIHQSLPDIEVVMTRTTDVFNTVVEKAKIANAAKGDLFICIHTNSADPSRNREIIGHTKKTRYVKKNGKFVS